MSTIPLPAMGVNTQGPSPLDVYSKAQQIIGQQTANQERQAQLVGTQQENQQRALSLQDQQTLRALAPNHVIKDTSGNVTGFDTEGFLNDAAGKQVNPSTLNSLRLNYADTVSKLASADSQVRANEQAKNKALYETLESVRGIQDPAQRQSALAGALPNLKKLGVDTTKIPTNQPLTDDMLTSAEAGLGMHAQAITDAKTLSETVKNTADAQLANMEAQEKGSPLTKMENDPTMFAGDKLPASMAYLQSKVNDPNPATATRATRLLSTAQVAQKTQLAMDASKKATDQAIQDGDPNAAAKLLIDGTVAPSQLISSRKPEFAQKAFTAAQQMQPGWNAQKADADFKVASSPQQVAFFGSAKSLTDPGGTLDQLKAAGDDIPGGKIPVFNSIADAIRASTGSGPIAKYASIALGVADDYSKVMGGGQGSDTSRTQALQLISAKQSPEQRAASIEGIRGAVGSQASSRIGNNAVLQKMYGGNLANAGAQTPSGPPPGATHTAKGSDGKLHWTDSTGTKDFGVKQ
jgi:hypothetical protein